jgi:hypothetical protein
MPAKSKKLLMGLEPMTSSLPRTRSTTELQQQANSRKTFRRQNQRFNQSLPKNSPFDTIHQQVAALLSRRKLFSFYRIRHNKELTK